MLARLESIERKVPFYEGLILETREMHPGMGLRTIYEKHQPDGIGRDRFIKLGIDLGLCMDLPTNRKRTTYTHRGTRYLNLLVDTYLTDVNQVWATDITYFKIGLNTFYISLVMDLYSKRILGHYCSDNLLAVSSAVALQMALDIRGIKNYKHTLIHHSDRGSQYVSELYTEILGDYKIKISMCSNVYENTMQERVNRTIKNQYLKHWKIKNQRDLASKLDQALYAYNYDKPHSALFKMSPVEFEESLKTIPQELRVKIKIFTFDNRAHFDPNQTTISF